MGLIHLPGYLLGLLKCTRGLQDLPRECSYLDIRPSVFWSVSFGCGDAGIWDERPMMLYYPVLSQLARLPFIGHNPLRDPFPWL